MAQHLLDRALGLGGGWTACVCFPGKAYARTLSLRRGLLRVGRGHMACQRHRAASKNGASSTKPWTSVSECPWRRYSHPAKCTRAIRAATGREPTRHIGLVNHSLFYALAAGTNELTATIGVAPAGAAGSIDTSVATAAAATLAAGVGWRVGGIAGIADGHDGRVVDKVGEARADEITSEDGAVDVLEADPLHQRKGRVQVADEFREARQEDIAIAPDVDTTGGWTILFAEEGTARDCQVAADEEIDLGPWRQADLEVSGVGDGAADEHGHAARDVEDDIA